MYAMHVRLGLVADLLLVDRLLGGDQLLRGLAVGLGGHRDRDDLLLGRFALGLGGKHLGLRRGALLFLLRDRDFLGRARPLRPPAS